MTERDVPVGIIFPVGFQIQGQGARGAPLQHLSILGRELHALQVSTQLCQISPPSAALQLPSQGLSKPTVEGAVPVVPMPDYPRHQTVVRGGHPHFIQVEPERWLLSTELLPL